MFWWLLHLILILSPNRETFCVNAHQLSDAVSICSSWTWIHNNPTSEVSQGAANQVYCWPAWWKASIWLLSFPVLWECQQKHIFLMSTLLLSFGTLCILSHLGLNDRNNLFLPLRRIAWYRELTWSLLSEERTFWWKGEIWKILCAFNLSLYVILSYVYLSFLYTDHITHLYDSLILSLIEMKQTHKYS